MKLFNVWTRPLGKTCRVCVEGLKSGRWLFSKMEDKAGSGNCTSIGLDQADGKYSFLVSYTITFSQYDLDDLMAALPEVRIMNQPA